MGHVCKTRFCNARTGLCTTYKKVIKLNMTRHVTNQHLSWLSFDDARCPGALCGRARHMIILIIFGWLMWCRLRSRRMSLGGPRGTRRREQQIYRCKYRRALSPSPASTSATAPASEAVASPAFNSRQYDQ